MRYGFVHPRLRKFYCRYPIPIKLSPEFIPQPKGGNDIFSLSHNLKCLTASIGLLPNIIELSHAAGEHEMQLPMGIHKYTKYDTQVPPFGVFCKRGVSSAAQT